MFQRLRRAALNMLYGLWFPIVVVTSLYILGVNFSLIVLAGSYSVCFSPSINREINHVLRLGRNILPVVVDQREQSYAIRQDIIYGRTDSALRRLRETDFTHAGLLLSIGRYAIILNNNSVFKHLLRMPPFRDHLADNNNQLLINAVQRDRSGIVKRMLKNATVKNNAGTRDNYALRQACANGNLNIVRQLLRCPSVVAPSNITFNHNEALRLAQNYGDREDIVLRLLRLEAVANYIIPENVRLTFHVNGVGELDDFWLSGDVSNRRLDSVGFGRGESAMRRLDNRQLSALAEIKERYRDIYKERGLDSILKEIKRYLVSKYKEKPAKHKGKKLPLAHKASLSKAERRAYYRHPIHGAYRYLFLHPNPWISLAASFALVHEGGGRSADIHRNDKKRIAYMWLAANDQSRPLPEGFTRERVKEQFAVIMADMGRGHNRDHGRDDYTEGDKPTCSNGVVQSAVQFLTLFLNDNAQTRPLDADAIKRKFGETLITEGRKNSTFDKLTKMDTKTLEDLGAALDKHIADLTDKNELSEEQKALLAKIELTSKRINAFVKECKEYFGKNRITQKVDKPIAYFHLRFNSYEELIRHFGKNSLGVYYEEIKGKIDQLTNKNKNKKAKSDQAIPESTHKQGKILTFRKLEKKGKPKASDHHTSVENDEKKKHKGARAKNI